MGNRIFKKDILAKLASAMLRKGGFPDDAARTIADDLVAADLRGLYSHGVSRIPMYLNRLHDGLVNAEPKIKITRISHAAASVDGDDGMGFIVSHKAMEYGVGLAETAGIALIGIKRSTHFGMAALYVKQALDAGLNSIIFTNSSPALAPWGARSAFLGAAPLAAGMIGGHASPPYMLDMAMTVIARGKIRVAMTNGDSIPPGVALDKDGNPTTDPKEAFEGVCLPFGGVKGASLAMLMDLIAGLYTGAGFGGDVKSLYYDHTQPQNVGHLFILMKPDLFISLDEYKTRMDSFYIRLKNLPKASGAKEIFMPGEPEMIKEKESLENGILVTENIMNDLAGCAREMNLDLSEYLEEA